MSYPYRFRQGYTGFGIGAEDMGLERPTTLPIDSMYSARHNVLHTLAPQAPGYVKEQQYLVPVSLLANGLYFGGTLALQALADFERANQ